MIREFFQVFRPNTVNGVLKEVFSAIDDLEVIAAQQEEVADARQAEITQLQLEWFAAMDEQARALAISDRLRAFVEV